MGYQIARQPIVPVPPDEECGPDMLKLTDPQRAFVIAMVTSAAPNPTQAAMIAGYGNTADSTRVATKVLMRNPRVLAAIREESDKRLRSGALLAANKLCELIQNPDPKIALKAALAVLDRSDLQITTRHEVTVKKEGTSDDIVKAIVELAKKTGQNPRDLLGYDPSLPVIDAEVVEVKSDDLEDILG